MMQSFVIMTKGAEKRLLDAADEVHIAYFKELGFKVTGKGEDRAAAHDVERAIRLAETKRADGLAERLERIGKILQG